MVADEVLVRADRRTDVRKHRQIGKQAGNQRGRQTDIQKNRGRKRRGREEESGKSRGASVPEEICNANQGLH